MKYIEYIREYISIQIGMLIVDGMAKYSGQLVGKPFVKMFYSLQPTQDKSWWGWGKEDLEAMGRFLVNNAQRADWLREHLRLYDEIIKEAQFTAEKVKRTKLSKLSSQNLVNLYSELRVKTERFHALTMSIDSVDIELEEQLRTRLEQLYKKKRDQNEAYAIITTPSELSCPKKEELLLYKLALKFQKTCELDSDLVKSVFDKFWWSELDWRAGNEKNMAGVKKGVQDIIKETRDIKKHIKKLEDYPREVAGLKERYLKHEEVEVLNDIFEHYARLHDLRKEAQLKTTHSIYLILKELERRFKIELEHLELYTPEEIINLLSLEGRDRLSLKEVSARLNCVTVLINDEKITFKTDQEAVKLRKKEMGQNVLDIRDFSGLPASRGKAVGKVKVVLSSKEALEKIKKGDILVTSMTLPNFVPAMKKSSAIVTNEGGATCHAAIISREFNIPCIVATKIATQILKDGMIVEVNANHGIVKILEK